MQRSSEVIFESQNGQDDSHSHLDELADFVWHLSVAKQDELDEVYKTLVEDRQWWKLSVSVQAIFGRVYAASLTFSDPKKALEVSKRLLFPYCDPLEWEDLKDGLALQTDYIK